VQLHARNLTWEDATARLHLSSENLSSNDCLLIIAPHPDDAEIAAFGVYCENTATLVTLTTGDNSDRYQSNRSQIRLSREEVRKIRVWDSLAVPQLGDLGQDRVMNLCFPDGHLQALYSDPNRNFLVGPAEKAHFRCLRQMNHSPLVGRNEADCTWRHLVKELSEIIKAIKPTVIVTPHPLLDPHPDHVFATAAVVEALEPAGLKDGRVFFYCVHNRRSELWPFGPQGSGVALLPVLLEDGQCGTGFYSHPLSAERQRAKFIALEAMHDIRDIVGLCKQPLLAAVRSFADELRGVVNGMGANPTDYLRRAIRPDELFFVASFADARILTQRAVATFEPIF
jgi:LmbE family N-acetylglucosaminyl deacetylase